MVAKLNEISYNIRNMNVDSAELYESKYKEWLKHPELNLPEYAPQYDVITGDVESTINSEFVVDGLYEAVRTAKEKLFLHPDAQQVLPLAEQEIQLVDFVENKEWREERLESAHKVFFGWLGVNSDGVNGPRRDTLPIACKPYHQWYKGVIHEYASSEYINEQRRISAFEPVGIWVDGEGNSFLLTHFEKNVRTLDNIDWRRTEKDAVEDHIDIYAAMERSGYILGLLHAQGLTHRDAQVKNMGYDTKTAAVRAIDLEQLRLVQTPEYPDLEAMHFAILNDLLAFIGSAQSSGYRWGLKEEDRSQILRSTFLEFYKGIITHPSSGVHVNYKDEGASMIDQVCGYIGGLSEEQIEEYCRTNKLPLSRS